MSSELYSSSNINARNTSTGALERAFREVTRNPQTTKERNSNSLNLAQKRLAASMLDDYLSPMAVAYHNIFSTIDEIQEYIYNKYYENSEYSFYDELSSSEKYAMYQNDINAVLYGLDENNINFNDPRLNFSAEDWARINSNPYDLDRLNSKMEKILEENKINLKEDSYFVISFNPYNYQVSISGNENNNTIQTLTNALNKNQNSKDFFLYTLQNTNQLNQDSVDKMQAYQNVFRFTGESLQNLILKDGIFYNSNDQNILDVMKNNINNLSSNNSYLNSQYLATSDLLKNIAQLGWNNIPDLKLSMVYSMREGIFVPGVVYNI